MSASQQAASTPDLAVLVVDDNPRSVELLAAAIQQPGVEVLTATDPEAALDIVFERRPQVVVTDLVMPNMSGMELLQRVVEFDPAIDVILITAHYSTESAVEAIKKGASDYLNKPVAIAAFREKVSALLAEARRRQQALRIEDELASACDFHGILGRSPLMWDMFSRIQRVAPHYRTILLTGETGAGKDLVARAIHQLSPAARGEFVALNCSAVVETLFESELFGHVKGAFTGAVQDKPGLFEHAHGGTLLLDEIGDMPLATQAKLLRVLQNREVQRLGSLTARRVDVRVIAATHRDLRAAIARREFREDLYYRIAMVEIHVPALRERMEDLPLLTRYFIERFARQYGKTIRGITRRAQIALSRHTWPGNVRELENAIGHAAMMAMGDTIDVHDLPPPVALGRMRSEQSALALAHSPAPGSLEEHEKAVLVDALERAGGNQSQAARMLRIGRDALRYKMKKHNLL
jgi:DNA-binding NtrC family response regulator